MKIRIGICDDSDHDRHYLKSIIKNYFKGREIEPEIVEYGSGDYKNFRQRQGLCLPPVIMI